MENSFADGFDPSINGIDNLTVNEDENWKCGESKRMSRLSYFTRIIGGRPAIPGAWPWQVAVLNRHGVRWIWIILLLSYQVHVHLQIAH